MEEKRSRGTMKLVSAEESADISKVWEKQPEPEKRKLEIHLSTEVSEEQHNEIMMKLYAFVMTLPISANDMRRLCGVKPVDDPRQDMVFVPLKTAE